MGSRNSGQCRVDFGETVRGATRGRRLACREHGYAGGVMGMVSKEHRNQNRCVEETGHPSALPEHREVPLAPDHINRVGNNRRVEWLAGTKHGDAAFFNEFWMLRIRLPGRLRRAHRPRVHQPKAFGSGGCKLGLLDFLGKVDGDGHGIALALRLTLAPGSSFVTQKWLQWSPKGEADHRWSAL